MAAPPTHRHPCHLIRALKMIDIHLQVWEVWVAMGQVTAISSSSRFCLLAPCMYSWVAIVQTSKCSARLVLESGNLVVCIPERIAGICLCCWSDKQMVIAFSIPKFLCLTSSLFCFRETSLCMRKFESTYESVCSILFCKCCCFSIYQLSNFFKSFN
jgi:hypothetical protein